MSLTLAAEVDPPWRLKTRSGLWLPLTLGLGSHLLHQPQASPGTESPASACPPLQWPAGPAFGAAAVLGGW